MSMTVASLSGPASALSPFAALDQARLPLLVSALLHTYKDSLPAWVEAYFSEIAEPVAFLDLTGLVLMPQTLEKVRKWFPNCTMYVKGNRPVSDTYYEPIFLEMIRYAIVNKSTDFSKRVAFKEIDAIYAKLLNDLQKLVDGYRTCRVQKARQVAPASLHPFVQALPYLLPAVVTSSAAQDPKVPYKQLMNLFVVSRRFANLRRILATSVCQLRSPNEASTAAKIPAAPVSNRVFPQNPAEELFVTSALQSVASRAVTVLDLRTLPLQTNAKWAARLAATFPQAHTLYWPFKMPLSKPVAEALARMPIRTLNISLADKSNVEGLACFPNLTELSNNQAFLRCAWQTREAYQVAFQEMRDNSPPLDDIRAFEEHRETTPALLQATSKLTKLERLDLGCSDAIDDRAFAPLAKLQLKELGIGFSKVTVGALRHINPVQLASLDVMDCPLLGEAGLTYIGKNFVKLRRFYHTQQTPLTKIALHISALPLLEALMIDLKKPITRDECVAVARLPKLQKLAMSCAKQFPENGLAAFAAADRLRFLRLEECTISDAEVMVFRQLRERTTLLYYPPQAAAAPGPRIQKADTMTAAGAPLDMKRDSDVKTKPDPDKKQAAALAEAIRRFQNMAIAPKALPHDLRKMAVDVSFLGKLDAYVKAHPDLTELMLPPCDLNSKALKLLANLPKLVRLDATLCRSYDLREIAIHCPGLTYFRNELSDPYEALWLDPTQADALRANYNTSLPENHEGMRMNALITRADFTALTRLKKLTTLHLDNVEELSGKDFHLLEQMPQLEELHLDTATLSEKEALLFAKLLNLHTLNITRAPIGDVGLAHITQHLKKLRAFYLANNLLTAQGMKSLARLTELETLSLGFQKGVVEAGYLELLHLQKLKRLLVVDTGQLPDRVLIQIIQKCAALQTLHFLSTAAPSLAVLQAAEKRKVLVLHTTIEAELQAEAGMTKTP